MITTRTNSGYYHIIGIYLVTLDQFDHISQLKTLSVITLSGFHCIYIFSKVRFVYILLKKKNNTYYNLTRTQLFYWRVRTVQNLTMYQMNLLKITSIISTEQLLIAKEIYWRKRSLFKKTFSQSKIFLSSTKSLVSFDLFRRNILFVHNQKWLASWSQGINTV